MGKFITDSEIGKKIKELRLKAGLTQEKLAEMLGITFQQIQKYEKGVTKVNLQKLQQLAAAFQVTPAVFFNDSKNTECILTFNEMELLKNYRRIQQEHHKESILVITSGLAKTKD